MTFERWLKLQYNRNSPIGDLARDFIESNDEKCNKKTLIEREACIGAFDALFDALTEYRRIRKLLCY